MNWPQSNSFGGSNLFGTPSQAQNGQQQQQAGPSTSTSSSFATPGGQQTSFGYSQPQQNSINSFNNFVGNAGNVQSSFGGFGGAAGGQQQQQQPIQGQGNGFGMSNSTMISSTQQFPGMSTSSSGFFNQQPQLQQGGYGSPYGNSGFQPTGGAQPASNNGTAASASGVPRYMAGYLSNPSLSQSPRALSNNSIEPIGSPEQHPRELGSSSYGGSSSRMFTSSTSSAGTPGGRDSPSRSPRSVSFSTPSYGSKSLALARARQAQSSGDYMDEDAPPTDSLAEYENDSGPAYLSNGPPTASGSRTPLNGNSTTSASSGHGIAAPSLINGQQIYKVTVFGFPSAMQSNVISQFASLGSIVYNSLSSSSPSDGAPEGANWVTIGYDNENSAHRALRKNGEIIGGNCMIGVKPADAAPGQSFVPSEETTQPQQSLVQRQQPSTLGTPAMVLPASQAWLNKKASATPSKASAGGRLADLGKIDPKIFKEDQEKKPNGGVVGTLTNLIFGF